MKDAKYPRTPLPKSVLIMERCVTLAYRRKSWPIAKGECFAYVKI